MASGPCISWVGGGLERRRHMKPWVVMRSRNDMPLIAETLAMLRRQSAAHELLVFDNASTDGTLEEVARSGARVVGVPAGQYVPGKVLNQGMEMTRGEFVAFLNSDCTPADEHWLARLLDGFDSDRVAAVFGRQRPRPDCQPLLARDTESAFGDGAKQQRWRHCFSMASSAIRRSVWLRRPFNERLRYSEDIEWTWRARQEGHEIRYAPESVAFHSHNYTLRQLWRRYYGEGQAEAAIFDWAPWERSLLRYTVLPWGRQVLGDVRYCLGAGRLLWAARAPVVRAAQALGRRAGFVAGLKDKAAQP